LLGEGYAIHSTHATSYLPVNIFTKVAVPALLVSDVKGAIQEKIQSKQLDYFSSTTDLWTLAAGDPYMTFTVHFINDNWELKSYCLQAHYLPVDHTGANISEALQETVQQWYLDEEKLMGITTDSGSNVRSAYAMLGWIRLSCFGHNLNLAVGKGLNDDRVQCALRKCRSAITAFSPSWKKTERPGCCTRTEEGNVPRANHLN